VLSQLTKVLAISLTVVAAPVQWQLAYTFASASFPFVGGTWKAVYDDSRQQPGVGDRELKERHRARSATFASHGPGAATSSAASPANGPSGTRTV